MLLDELGKYSIILATGSPRRHDLLQRAGFDFSVYSDLNADESYPEDIKQELIAAYIAERKSDAYPEMLTEGQILITADTIVCMENRILQKPMDRSDAIQILERLSGNVHTVYTGVCLRSTEKKRSFISATQVSFDILADDEILYYIDHFKPYDKAGAYGIQEWIGYVGVKEIHGSYFNVMGMPVHRLYRELEQFTQ
mgnify:CR=1 FL=1